MVDCATSVVSALDDNSEKFVSVRQFSHKNSQEFDIDANLNQITEVIYALRKVRNDDKNKSSVSFFNAMDLNTAEEISPPHINHRR